MSSLLAPPLEAVESFPCFGGKCTVVVQGSGPAGAPDVAVPRAKRRLLEWHAQFSRFEPASELSRLNEDPRVQVPASAMMIRFVEAALYAATLTGGLVDPTLLSEVEQAGYREHFTAAAVPIADLGPAAPAPRPAAPHPAARWQEIRVDRRTNTVIRPPGLRLDGGGIAKGLFGDVLASVLGWHRSFAVVAAGDIRFGGTADAARRVQVTSPFDGRAVLHTFELVRGAVATSGITRRSWFGDDGRPAHHLIDPATGAPAFTGVVQATALAPSAVEAEALAKAAVLAGRDRAPGWLCHGGLVVYEDGDHDLIDPAGTEAPR